MRYVMKQRLFCWGDDFCIRNEAGQDVFFVDGRAFSIGQKLSFQDMAPNELATLRLPPSRGSSSTARSPHSNASDAVARAAGRGRLRPPCRRSPGAPGAGNCAPTRPPRPPKHQWYPCHCIPPATAPYLPPAETGGRFWKTPSLYLSTTRKASRAGPLWAAPAPRLEETRCDSHPPPPGWLPQSAAGSTRPRPTSTRRPRPARRGYER